MRPLDFDKYEGTGNDFIVVEAENLDGALAVAGELQELQGAGAIEVFQQANPDQYTSVARIPVGAGAGSTSLYLKTRTQEGLFMSWPNMLPQGGSEVVLFYVND